MELFLDPRMPQLQRPRRSTILTTHKIFLNNAIYRLGLLSLFLSIYYGINIWYYNAYKYHDDTRCGPHHLLVWCNSLQSKLFIASTTSILISCLIILVFVISMHQTYSYEQSFHTLYNAMNNITILMLSFILIISCIFLIIYSSFYLHSYIPEHHLSTHHALHFIIRENVKILNEICAVFILAFDLLHYHHIFRDISLLKVISKQSSRVSLMACILFIISFGFVMYLRMDKNEVGIYNYYNDMKCFGFLINTCVLMMISFKYGFQKLDSDKQIIKHDMSEGYERRLIPNMNYNLNQNDDYIIRLLFGIFFSMCLTIGIISIWIGKIYDLNEYHITKGIDMAMFVSPEILYSLQAIFLCVDMIAIKR